MSRKQAVTALTIAGSDSGGGAGIQADLKTFSAFKVHGASALAALTAQNTRGVTAVHVPPIEFLRAQIDAVFADFDVAVVKLGMLANAAVIEAVADALELHRPPFVVVDPVMVATSGARLLELDALTALRERLFPLATILTPNLPEAELLLGRKLSTSEAAREALEALLASGLEAVLLKGGHMAGEPTLFDHLGYGEFRESFEHPRLDVEAHGTGCTLASAIAAGLAYGSSLASACQDAIDYVQGGLRHPVFPGASTVAVLDHAWATRRR